MHRTRTNCICRKSLSLSLSLPLSLCLTSVPIGQARAGDPSLPAAAPHAAAPHGSTPAERQARGEAAARDFVVGRYDEALATYLDLYIQSDGRPEYLRNIGRCQQKLKQYRRAIESFKDYLRRAKHLGNDEQKEVNGFISEMEAALDKESAAASPAVTPSPAAPVPAPAAPAWAPGASTAAPTRAIAPTGTSAPGPAPAPAAAPPAATTPPPPQLAYQPSPQPAYPPFTPGVPAPVSPSAANRSPWRTIGIVSLVAAGVAAIGGTIALIKSKSTFDGAKDQCPGANSPYCDQKASSVQTANTLSKILYVSAGVLGAAGAALIIAAPAPSPEGRVSLAVSARWRF